MMIFKKIFYSSGFVSSSVGGTAPPSAIGIGVHGDEEEGERDVGEIYYTGVNNSSR
jgi:hypothetical protein